MGGFNAFQKRYLATCLRMLSTPEKDRIDSKRMRVETMTEKGEVSFGLTFFMFLITLGANFVRLAS